MLAERPEQVDEDAFEKFSIRHESKKHNENKTTFSANGTVRCKENETEMVKKLSKQLQKLICISKHVSFLIPNNGFNIAKVGNAVSTCADTSAMRCVFLLCTASHVVYQFRDGQAKSMRHLFGCFFFFFFSSSSVRCESVVATSNYGLIACNLSATFGCCIIEMRLLCLKLCCVSLRLRHRLPSHRHSMKERRGDVEQMSDQKNK